MDYRVKCKRIYASLLVSSFIILKLSANNNSDSLLVDKKPAHSKHLFLFTAGYRISLNQNKIINSGHGIYIEGGLNAGRLIAKDLVLGLYGGYALQDKFWPTSFKESFSNDYYASINKEQHLPSLDSAVIHSSADLFKNAKGNAVTMPGCATQSFHNYSLYYGFVLRLPFKYAPVLKIYRGTTRSHYQGDGNLATKQKEFNIFELRRNMIGCELALTRNISKTGNLIGVSAYYESCNFYNSALYFDDGSITRKIPLQSFTTNSFRVKYRNEVYFGIKLFYFLM